LTRGKKIESTIESPKDRIHQGKKLEERDERERKKHRKANKIQ
jgi:hypothetical protein